MRSFDGQVRQAIGGNGTGEYETYRFSTSLRLFSSYLQEGHRAIYIHLMGQLGRILASSGEQCRKMDDHFNVVFGHQAGEQIVIEDISGDMGAETHQILWDGMQIEGQ